MTPRNHRGHFGSPGYQHRGTHRVGDGASVCRQAPCTAEEPNLADGGDGGIWDVAW